MCASYLCRMLSQIKTEGEIVMLMRVGFYCSRCVSKVIKCVEFRKTWIILCTWHFEDREEQIHTVSYIFKDRTIFPQTHCHPKKLIIEIKPDIKKKEFCLQSFCISDSDDFQCIQHILLMSEKARFFQKWSEIYPMQKMMVTYPQER